ncbi:glycosyltransferase [Candidatus Poribacteria bacterium]|nr:glycosyltransferase [Candidatus Poribacteria bacterium]
MEATAMNAGSAAKVQKLSVLIPVYNEIRTIEALLERVMAAPLPCEREVVIVDDCSKDGSREALRRFAAGKPNVKLVFHKHNQGKGAAIRTAIRHFTGDWAIIQDADLEYDPSEYQQLLVPVQEGLADAVFGSRFLTGRYRRAMMFWHTLANKTLTLASNILNDLNLTDMETCYKLIRGDILKNLTIRSKGFDLEPELTAKLARWGARIYEVPISYRGRTYAEGKKIGAKDAYRAFFAMVRYRYLDTRYTNHDGFIILQALRRAHRFNRWLFSTFAHHLGDSVLEAGCGIGNLTELMLNKGRLVCVDNEDFYLDRLRQSYGHLANVRIHKADLTRAQDLAHAADGKLFDSAICINVMEHIQDDVGVLRNMFSVLKPGGRAVVLVPHDPSLYSAVDKVLGHFKRYTRKDLRRCMESAGFRVRECRGFNRVGGFGWRVSGKLLRKDTLSGGQMTVFEMLMPLVRVLEHIPFHSHNSLIIVGEKPK